MTWSLIADFGLDYAPAAPDETGSLLYPSLVERAGDDTYLIVDELFFGKYACITAECRTIRVEKSGRLLYDSREAGIHDGYGCLMDDGQMALLQRTRWKLLVLSATGAVQSVIDLISVSKAMPRLVTWTWRKTFLIAFSRGVGRIEIAEVDRHGRLLWYLPHREPGLGFPGSIQLLPNGHVLVADEFHHVSAELARDGSWVWQFGKRGHSAPDAHCLSNAKAIRQSADGSRVIADTRNHRVIRVAGHGDPTYLAPPRGSWSSPSFACKTPDDHFLICDAGNRRVVELDARGQVLWQYGHQIADRRWLSFPRSVTVTEPGGYLVADTANNRIVEVCDGALRVCAMTDGTELFWPRCVRKLPSGHYLIADGRHSRILEVSARGRVCRELGCVQLGGRRPLQDPHDVRQLDNGSLLIVDAASHLVVETDWSGRVSWAAGDGDGVGLSDPHSAQWLPTGEILICDTGNSRLLRLNRGGEIIQTLEAIRDVSQWFRLIRPRHAEVAADGTLIIADSDNNRIVAATLEGGYLWDLSGIPHARLPSLSQPRWVHAISATEFLVADHLHHRVLHLRRTGGAATGAR